LEIVDEGPRLVKVVRCPVVNVDEQGRVRW